MELGDKKEYSLSHTHTHTQTRIMMHSDWRYSIQYCMPRTDAVFNKLPISKVKYEVYKYLKNPVNTMITSAINESKRKISAEKEKCPPLCASASYKRFVAGIHEEREKNEKPEWRYIDKPILEKIHQHVNSYDSHYVNPALASDWMKIFNSSEDTTYAFTYREFTWLILQMCFMTAEKVDELWNSATPVPKRDPVHEIYWKLTIFEEIQKWSHRVAFREAIFEQEGHVNRQQGRINRVERGGRGYTYKYLKLNNIYEDMYWYSQHDNFSCGFIQYHSNSAKGKQKTSCRKIKYEQNRRVMPCKKYHSTTDLYYICKGFGIDVSNIDPKNTTKNVLMQKIYPNLRFS